MGLDLYNADTTGSGSSTLNREAFLWAHQMTETTE